MYADINQKLNGRCIRRGLSPAYWRKKATQVVKGFDTLSGFRAYFILNGHNWIKTTQLEIIFLSLDASLSQPKQNKAFIASYITTIYEGNSNLIQYEWMRL